MAIRINEELQKRIQAYQAALAGQDKFNAAAAVDKTIKDKINGQDRAGEQENVPNAVEEKIKPVTAETPSISSEVDGRQNAQQDMSPTTMKVEDGNQQVAQPQTVNDGIVANETKEPVAEPLSAEDVELADQKYIQANQLGQAEQMDDDGLTGADRQSFERFRQEQQKIADSSSRTSGEIFGTTETDMQDAAADNAKKIGIKPAPDYFAQINRENVGYKNIKYTGTDHTVTRTSIDRAEQQAKSSLSGGKKSGRNTGNNINGSLHAMPLNELKYVPRGSASSSVEARAIDVRDIAVGDNTILDCIMKQGGFLGKLNSQIAIFNERVSAGSIPGNQLKMINEQDFAMDSTRDQALADLADVLNDPRFEFVVTVAKSPISELESDQRRPLRMVRGDGVGLHVLAVKSFNADFDGDTATVHLVEERFIARDAIDAMLNTTDKTYYVDPDYLAPIPWSSKIDDKMWDDLVDYLELMMPESYRNRRQIAEDVINAYREYCNPKDGDEEAAFNRMLDVISKVMVDGVAYRVDGLPVESTYPASKKLKSMLLTHVHEISVDVKRNTIYLKDDSLSMDDMMFIQASHAVENDAFQAAANLAWQRAKKGIVPANYGDFLNSMCYWAGEVDKNNIGFRVVAGTMKSSKADKRTLIIADEEFDIYVDRETGEVWSDYDNDNLMAKMYSIAAANKSHSGERDTFGRDELKRRVFKSLWDMTDESVHESALAHGRDYVMPEDYETLYAFYRDFVTAYRREWLIRESARTEFTMGNELVDESRRNSGLPSKPTKRRQGDDEFFEMSLDDNFIRAFQDIYGEFTQEELFPSTITIKATNDDGIEFDIPAFEYVGMDVQSKHANKVHAHGDIYFDDPSETVIKDKEKKEVNREKIGKSTSPGLKPHVKGERNGNKLVMTLKVNQRYQHLSHTETSFKNRCFLGAPSNRKWFEQYDLRSESTDEAKDAALTPRGATRHYLTMSPDFQTTTMQKGIWMQQLFMASMNSRTGEAQKYKNDAVNGMANIISAVATSDDIKLDAVTWDMLYSCNPWVFERLGIDSPELFMASDYGKKFLEIAEELNGFWQYFSLADDAKKKQEKNKKNAEVAKIAADKFFGVYYSMMVAARIYDIGSLQEERARIESGEIENLTPDQVRSKLDYIDSMISRKLQILESSSPVWHAIVRDSIADGACYARAVNNATNPHGNTYIVHGMGSALAKIANKNQSFNKDRARKIGEQLVDIKRNGSAVPKHSSILDLIMDLDVAGDVKAAALADIVMFDSGDAETRPDYMLLQIEMGPGNTMMGSNNVKYSTRPYNAWTDSSYDARQRRIANEKRHAHGESHKSNFEWDQREFSELIAKIMHHPEMLNMYEDHIFHDAISANADPTFRSSEKNTQENKVNRFLDALQWKNNGGMQSDLYRGSDKPFRMVARADLTVQDLQRVLLSSVNGKPFTIVLYDESGSTCDINPYTLGLVKKNDANPGSERISIQELYEALHATSEKDEKGNTVTTKSMLDDIAWVLTGFYASPIVGRKEEQASDRGRGDIDIVRMPQNAASLSSILKSRRNSYGMSKMIMKNRLRDDPRYAAICTLICPCEGISGSQAHRNKLTSMQVEDRVIELIQFAEHLSSHPDFDDNGNPISWDESPELRAFFDKLHESTVDAERANFLSDIYDKPESRTEAENQFIKAINDFRIIAKECLVEDKTTDTHEYEAFIDVADRINGIANRMSNLSCDKSSVSLYYYVKQTFNGCKTNRSTPIEGYDTDKTAAMHPWCASRIDSLSIVPGSIRSEQDGVKDHIVDFDVIDAGLGQADDGSLTQDQFDARRLLPAIARYLLIKRSKGSEAFNLKIKKSGLDGTLSIMKTPKHMDDDQQLAYDRFMAKLDKIVDDGKNLDDGILRIEIVKAFAVYLMENDVLEEQKSETYSIDNQSHRHVYKARYEGAGLDIQDYLNIANLFVSLKKNEDGSTDIVWATPAQLAYVMRANAHMGIFFDENGNEREDWLMRLSEFGDQQLSKIFNAPSYSYSEDMSDEQRDELIKKAVGFSSKVRKPRTEYEFGEFRSSRRSDVNERKSAEAPKVARIDAFLATQPKDALLVTTTPEQQQVANKSMFNKKFDDKTPKLMNVHKLVGEHGKFEAECIEGFHKLVYNAGYTPISVKFIHETADRKVAENIWQCRYYEPGESEKRIYIPGYEMAVLCPFIPHYQRSKDGKQRIKDSDGNYIDMLTEEKVKDLLENAVEEAKRRKISLIIDNAWFTETNGKFDHVFDEVLGPVAVNAMVPIGEWHSFTSDSASQDKRPRIINYFDLDLEDTGGKPQSGGKYYVPSEITVTLEDSLNEYGQGDADIISTESGFEKITVNQNGEWRDSISNMFAQTHESSGQSDTFEYELCTEEDQDLILSMLTDIDDIEDINESEIEYQASKHRIDTRINPANSRYKQKINDLSWQTVEWVDRWISHRTGDVSGVKVVTPDNVAPGCIIAWAKCKRTYWDEYGKHEETIFAPIIPYPKESDLSKSAPQEMRINFISINNGDVAVKWTNVADMRYRTVKFHEGNYPANKFMIYGDPVGNVVLADGTKVDFIWPSVATASRLGGPQARMETIYSMLLTARTQPWGYNFGDNEHCNPDLAPILKAGGYFQMPNEDGVLETTYLSIDRWKDILSNPSMKLYHGDDKFDEWIKGECMKMIEIGENPTSFLASGYYGSDGKFMNTCYAWQFQMMFELDMPYQDNMMRFLSEQCTGFCPSSMDEAKALKEAHGDPRSFMKERSKYLYFPCLDEEGNAFMYGAMRQLVPRNTADGVYWTDEIVRKSFGFLSDDNSALKSPSISNSDTFLQEARMALLGGSRAFKDDEMKSIMMASLANTMPVGAWGQSEFGDPYEQSKKG